MTIFSLVLYRLFQTKIIFIANFRLLVIFLTSVNHSHFNTILDMLIVQRKFLFNYTFLIYY